MNQLTFKLDVSRRFKNKTGYDHGYELNTSFKTETHTPESLRDDVIAGGWPYTMVHLKRSPQATGADERGCTTPKNVDNWVSMQVATFDDDSGEGDVVAFWLEDPFFAAHGWAFVESASSTPERQKGHPTLIFDRPVTDPKLYKEILIAFCTAYPRLDWLVNIDRTIYNGVGARVHELGNVCSLDEFVARIVEPWRAEEARKAAAIEAEQERKRAEWKRLKAQGRTVSGNLEEAWLGGWLNWLFDKVANTASGGNPSRNGALYWAGRAVAGAMASPWTQPHAHLFADVEGRIVQAATVNGYLVDYAHGDEREVLRIFERGRAAGGQVLDEPRPTRVVETSRNGNRKAQPYTHTYKEIMARLKTMREEQARGWLAQMTDEGAPEPNFANKCRALMKDAGALDELQIQEVLDEIMRHPALAPKRRTELARIWQAANKRLRDAMRGNATDDEIAASYKADYENKRMYTRGRWYRWKTSGVWSDDADVCDELWSKMVEFKAVNVNPTAHKRYSVEECLQGTSFLGVHEQLVDAHPEWVNVLNGVYDFETGTLIAHDPGQYLTTQLPFEYDPGAACPRWDLFLEQVLVDAAGNADPAMASFMQQAFGYSLTAWTKYEVSFWLQGSGANGKSTLIHILTGLMGTAAMALNLGMLDRDQYQLALLPGVRVVTCTESPVGLKVADSLIKTLISGDATTARLPYGKPFQLVPTAKIWWAMNNYPRVADTSEGFWRKVKVIPFLATFNGQDRDDDLRVKLEAELPGVFNWALGGLRSLVSDGWVTCDAIDGATETYRKSNDVESVFVEECCIRGAGFEVGASQLYDAYRDWCVSTRHSPKSSTRVSADWLRLGFERKRRGDGIYYLGVGLLHRPIIV